MIIGIVGKVGSGKTVCSKYLMDKYGAIIFSCDDVAKEMVKNNEIDLNINADDFFSNKALQEQVRTYVHPKVFLRIYENIYNLLEQKVNESKIFVIETALPCIEFIKSCNAVIYIENPYEKKMSILKEKRGYDEVKINKILDSQEYYDKFYNMSSFKIVNDGSIEDLYKKLDEVINEICVIRK